MGDKRLCIYIKIWQSLLDGNHNQKEIIDSQIKEKLHWFRIPKKLYPRVIKEMEELNLIEGIGKSRYMNRYKIKC